MRMRPWILGGLLFAWCAATPAAMRANAIPAYTDCLESAQPAECLARQAVESSRLRPRELLDAVLRHGLVDLISEKWALLLRGLDSVEPQVRYAGMSSAMRQEGRKSMLAAIALLAAARHEADPFANPIYLELEHAADDDPRIPVLAMAVWVKYVGINGWERMMRVTHAGLPAIWARAVARKHEDAALLAEIAGDLGELDELKPQARDFLVWYAQRPEELTEYERFRMAAQLARYFELPELAESLLWGLGLSREWSMRSVRTHIVVARLAKGYDATSARFIVNTILEGFGNSVPLIRDYDEGKRDALERAGARDELRELGAAYVAAAEKSNPRPFESGMYAAASDFYMRAGDRETALALARRALPYLPELVRRVFGHIPGVDPNDPAAMIHATQGIGTDAAVALYRAGAIDEALKTRYLTGWDRYRNAERAGKKKDPQWVIDDHWLTPIDLMANEVAGSNDRELQQRAYDGLVRSCGTPLAKCAIQTLRNIAQVAAGMGDRLRMKEALAAALRQIDPKGKDAGGWVLTIAGPWAHCEELLASD